MALKIVNGVWVGEGESRKKLVAGDEDELVSTVGKEAIVDLVASGAVIDDRLPDPNSVEVAEAKSEKDSADDAVAAGEGRPKRGRNLGEAPAKEGE